MSDLRKAMRMALERLESHEYWMDEEAIQALRQALAQLEQEPVVGKGKEFSEQLKLCARNVAFAASGHVDMSSAAMQEMFALIDHVCVGLDSPPALAQTEQEPVAWANADDLQNFNMRVRTNCDHYHTVPLYTAPPSIQAAVLAEREACAKLCDEKVDAEYATGKVDHNEMGWTQSCAAAIRARGEK